MFWGVWGQILDSRVPETPTHPHSHTHTQDSAVVADDWTKQGTAGLTVTSGLGDPATSCPFCVPLCWAMERPAPVHVLPLYSRAPTGREGTLVQIVDALLEQQQP